MNKKKTVVLSLLLVVIVTLTSCLLYACDPDNSTPEPEKIEATEGLLIQNGDFKLVNEDATTYPRSMSNWSGSKMYSSSSFRDDVIAGAISLESDLYGANKQAWDDADETLKAKLTTGGHGDDKDAVKNVLMIYQPKLSKNADDKDQHGPTAYGYTSASFTLSKGSYYVLSVDVLTYDIKGSLDDDGNQIKTSEPGARIYVSSNTYAEFAAIDTKGEWKTYTVYIETSPVSSTSLTVQLGLGKYTASYSDGLTSGYAFFDNLSLKKLVKEADNADIEDDDVANLKVADPEKSFQTALTEEKAFDAATDKNSVKAVATTTLKVPNGRFDFGSYNLSSSGVPNSWTHVTGNSGKENPAPTGLGYNAIIDTSKFAENYTKYSSSYRTKTSPSDAESLLYTPAATALKDLKGLNDYDRVGKNVFMLSQQLMTAQGIRSSRTITIEKGKTYELKISLFAASVRGAGVSLILSGTDGKDIVIEGIAQNKRFGEAYLGNRKLDDPANGYTGPDDYTTAYTSDAWEEYTFYIKGNPYKDYSYNFAIWLGTEGTNSNTPVSYYNFSQNSKSTTYQADGTFSTGWLFIDGLELNELPALPATGETIANAKDEDNTIKLNVYDTKYVGAIVDLADQNTNELDDYLDPASSSATKPEVESVGSGAPNGWTSNYDLTDNTNPRIEGFVREGVVNIATENEFDSHVGDKLGAYPGLPYDMPVKKAYAMYASQDSYYEVETAPITIEANRFYRVSFWLKTVDVKDTSGAYVYVLNKTAQKENKEKNGKDDEVILTSITRINTDDYDEYLNDWVEINLVFRGAVKDKTDIAIKLTLGTGNRWATTTLTSGALYVANFNMADLTYANYTGTSSSTYTKTCDLSTSYTYQFTNGSFDNYDLDDENLNSDINHLYDQDVPATPDSWDISDETIEKNKNDGKTNLYAGIIQLEDDATVNDTENFFFSSSNQAVTATGIDADFFDKFYGDKSDKQSYYSDANMKAIAGPNVLAIGSKSSEKFAIGFTSNSFTLSANTFNVLSIYAKTYGNTKATIRLTGEASSSGNNGGANNFVIESSSTDGGWTKYVFFIKVGKNSVSLKLNLWLGDDVQYLADEDDSDYEAKVEEAKSAGHVFFDNISSYTLSDEDKYKDAIEDEKNAGSKINELDFNVESFDPLSSSVESRRTLTSPSGWTGSADTNQSSSNTKSGIIYTGDDNYFETKEIEGEATKYSKLLGKDYTEENSDITVSADELNEYKTQNQAQTQGLTDYEVRKLIIEDKIKELERNNWIPSEQLTGANKAHNGDHMLIINNMTKSAYTYTSSSNTLQGGNKVYKISVFMRTYGLNNAANDDDFKDATTEEQAEALRKEKEIGAYIELYLGSANETGNEFAFKAVSSSEWTEYCFYVQTHEDDVTSVTIKLSLGKYINKDVDGKSVTNGLTTGYAMFDDITITELTEGGEEEFTNAQNKLDPENSAYDADYAKTHLARKVASSESGTPTEPDDESETPKSSFNLDYLWWMIPTIVLGLVIIIVLVVFVIRKVRKATPNKPAKIKKSPTSPSTAQALDEKRDRYDQDKD